MAHLSKYHKISCVSLATSASKARVWRTPRTLIDNLQELRWDPTCNIEVSIATSAVQISTYDLQKLWQTALVCRPQSHLETTSSDG